MWRSQSCGSLPCHRIAVVVVVVALLSWPAGAAAQHHDGATAATSLPHKIPELCLSVWDRTVVGAAETRILTGTHSCVEVRGAATVVGQLFATTILVYPGGQLTLADGSETIFRNVPLDAATDPEQWSNGLLVIDGTVHAQGQAKTAFVRLSAEPLAGAATLTLSAPVSGWQVGDRILVPDTRHLREVDWFNAAVAPQHEVRTIAAIDPGALTVTLNAPLTYAHRGARDANGTPTVLSDGTRFLPHVANLTRSIRVRSENPAGVRGHIMFTGRSDVRLQGVVFTGLGRTRAVPLDSTLFDSSGQVTHLGTNQIGRYSVHLHHLWGPANPTNTGDQFVFADNVIDSPLKWPLAIHGSHYGRVEDNVIYGDNNLNGAGISLEDGSESGNVIARNFVVGILGAANPRQSGPDTVNGTTPGSAGECIWGAGFNNRFIENVVAGCRNAFQQVASGIGFKFITAANSPLMKNPRFRGADMKDPNQTVTVQPQRQPILEFSRNEVYGLAATGLSIWHLGSNGYDVPGASESVFSDFRVWHTYDGALWNYPINHLILENLTYRIDAANATQHVAAVVSGDYRTIDLTIRGGTIHAGAVLASVTDPLGTITVENVTAITREHAFKFRTPATPGTGAQRPSSGVTMILRGNRISPWPGQPLRTIAMIHDLTAYMSDPADRYVVQVVDYQGQPGVNFNVYFGVQATTAQFYGGAAPCADTTTRPEVSGITCSVAPSAPDNDADGVPDILDLCPATASGTLVNAVGCPIIVSPLYLQNGDFSLGMTGWLQYATPTASHIVSNVTNGVLQFYRVSSTGSNQAVVFQRTGIPVAATLPITATFALGNSSTVRKRISVVIHDNNFADLTLCTFWLAPQTPLRTYAMRTHTTRPWTNAVISFYAASVGNQGGFYQIDNVAIAVDPGAGSFSRTDCLDPAAPAPAAGAPSANFLVNGDFGTGAETPWTMYGDVLGHLVGGSLTFRRFNKPGVVIQASNQTIAASQILTTGFSLANSSAIRQRVTVVVHDNDFSDLMACTFWLPAGQQLSPYVMRGFTTEAWANATVSVYAATIDQVGWLLLDDVTLQRTPASATAGTECLEPAELASSDPAVSSATGALTTVSGPIPSVPGLANTRAPRRSDGRAAGAERPVTSLPSPDAPRTPAISVENPVVRREDVIDLRAATAAQLTFRSSLSTPESRAEVQVSGDGIHWVTVALVPAADDWQQVTVDLAPFVGELIQIRFVWFPNGGDVTDEWRVDDLHIERWQP